MKTWPTECAGLVDRLRTETAKPKSMLDCAGLPSFLTLLPSLDRDDPCEGMKPDERAFYTWFHNECGGDLKKMADLVWGTK